MEKQKVCTCDRPKIVISKTFNNIVYCECEGIIPLDILTRDKVNTLIESYWKFDEQQQSLSSWHDKQNLFDQIEKLFKNVRSSIEKRENYYVTSAQVLNDFVWKGNDKLKFGIDKDNKVFINQT